jgi:hypothetical protein
VRAEAKRSLPDGSGTPSRHSTRFAIGLLIAALALLALAPSAMADIFTRAKTASFGSDGTALSSFDAPGSLAFNQATDRLYVRDGNFSTPIAIHAFDVPGLTLPGGAFPLTVDPAGVSPSALAVDNTVSPSPSAGNIYYAHSYPNNKVFGFRSDGTPLGGNFAIALPASSLVTGVGVDPDGNLYVSDGATANRVIRKYDSAGNPLATISTSAQGGPGDIAFDSNSDLFFSVIPLGGGAVGVYKATAASGYASVTRLSWRPEFSGQPPSALAVDTTSHTLYVADKNTVSAFNATTDAFLYDFAYAIHSVGAGSPAFEGVAVDQATDTVYVSDASSGQDKVHVFGPAQNYADATATPTAPRNVTDASAEIGATIDDNNVLPTNWRLEFSDDDGSTWRTVRTGQTAGGQRGVVVSATVSGLFPNTAYKVRVITNKGTSAATEVTSLPLSFRTLAVAPAVADLGAVQVTDTSARLVGTIDPKNSPTGYVFEYGKTPALGSSTAPVNIGGGTTPITVSQVVGGLSKDTTYYFRLVATNLTGTTTSLSKTLRTRTDPLPPADPGNCSNEALRQEQSSEFLPDCRAYEMVSPPDKNQGSITIDAGQIRVGFSRDGQGVSFCTSFLFGDPPPQMTLMCGAYLSKRGPGGWRTSSPFPPFCYIDYDAGKGGEFHAFLPRQSYDRVAIDLPEFASCPIPPLDPAASPGISLYREDLTTDPFDFDLLTPAPSVAGSGFSINAGQFAAGNDDFSHIVYVSRSKQTPDSPAAPFNKLYDWEEEGYDGCATPGGCLSLLSKKPNGEAFGTPSKLPGYGIDGAASPLASSVSSDGERIYFQNATGPGDFPAGDCVTAACDLYLREGGATTTHVSASECTMACGADESPAVFIWANPAGDKALFLSCAKLTNASADPNRCEVAFNPRASQQLKLYRWDRSAPPGNRLVDLSVDNEPADGTQPRAVDLIGASDDGDVVYFVSGGQIVSGAPTSTISGTPLKLYRWQWNGGSPSVDYLAPYRSTWANGSTDNDGDNVGDDPNANRRHVRVTPDGRYLLIQTKLALDAAGDRDSDADLYRWEEEGGWLCVSCQLPGVASAGHASSFETYLPHNSLSKDLVSHEPEHTISDDGQRVFFSTPDALVPEDTNGNPGCPLVVDHFSRGKIYRCQDVYEWHDGTVSLLTPGTGSNPFILIGATRTGEDVFFATYQRLVGWDVDNGTDIYTAHAGGGFPEPPPVPPACDLEAGACEGPGTTAAAIAGAGSAAFQGQGNPAPRPQARCPRGKRRVVRNGRTRCVAKKRKRNSRAANHNRRAAR